MLLFGLPLRWQVSESDQIQYFFLVVQPTGLFAHTGSRGQSGGVNTG